MPIYNKTIWIGDVHAPDHDPIALATVREIIADFKPARMIFLGDFFDCYGLSRFDKEHRRNTVKEDIEIGVNELARFVEAGVRARKGVKTGLKPALETIFMMGNHEDRLLRRMKGEQDMGSLIDPMNVFQFKKAGIQKVFDYKAFHSEYGVYSTHGWRCTKTAGSIYMSSLGSSGVSGHTHKLNEHSMTTVNKQLTWCEAGHLLDASKATYTHHHDWQQGVVVGWGVSRKGDIRPSTIPIKDGKVLAGMIL